jgi:hypothetical protein
MTLPASGAISVNDILTELQMSTSLSVTDRGSLDCLGITTEGGLVAIGNAVSFSNFRGKTFGGWTFVNTVSFSDFGTYFQTPDYNAYIGGTDYRFHYIQQGKGANKGDRWIRIVISRPTGGTMTAICRRTHLVGCTDVNMGDRSWYQIQSGPVMSGRITRGFVWDYGSAGHIPAQVVAGNNYTFGIIMESFN